MMAVSRLVSLAIAATSHSARTPPLSSRLTSLCLHLPCRTGADVSASASAAVASAAASSLLTADATSAAAGGLRLSCPSPPPSLAFDTLLALYYSSCMPRSSAASHSTAAAPAGACVLRPARGTPQPFAGSLLSGPAAAASSVSAAGVFRITQPPAAPAALPGASTGAASSVWLSSALPAAYVRASHGLMCVQGSSPTSGSRDGTRSSRAGRGNSVHKKIYRNSRDGGTSSSASTADSGLDTSGAAALRVRLKEGSSALYACSSAPSWRRSGICCAAAAWQVLRRAGDVRVSRRKQHQEHRATQTAKQRCVSLLCAAAVHRLFNTFAGLVRPMCFLTSAQQLAVPLKQEQRAAQQRQRICEGRGDQHKQQVRMSAVELHVLPILYIFRSLSLYSAASHGYLRCISLRRRFSTDAAVNYAAAAIHGPSRAALRGLSTGAVAAGNASFSKGGCSLRGHHPSRPGKQLWTFAVPAPIFLRWPQPPPAKTLSVCQCGASRGSTVYTSWNPTSSLSRAACTGSSWSNTTGESITAPVTAVASRRHNTACRRGKTMNRGTAGAAATVAACSVVAFPAILAFTAAASSVCGSAVSEYRHASSVSPLLRWDSALALCCDRCLFDVSFFLRHRRAYSAGCRCGVDSIIWSESGAAPSASTGVTDCVGLPRGFAYSYPYFFSGGAALLRHSHPPGGANDAAVPSGVLCTTIVAAATVSSLSRNCSVRLVPACGGGAPALLRAAAAAADSEVPTAFSKCSATAAAAAARVLVSAPKGATASLPSVSAAFSVAANATAAPSFVACPCSRRAEMHHQKRDKEPMKRDAHVRMKSKKLSSSARHAFEGEDRGRATAAVASLGIPAARSATEPFAAGLAVSATGRRKTNSPNLSVSAVSSRVAEGQKKSKMQEELGGESTASPLPSTSPAVATAAALVTKMRHSCSSTRGARRTCCVTARPLQQLQQKQSETQPPPPPRQLQERSLHVEKQQCQQEVASARQQQQQPAAHACRERWQSGKGGARLWLNVNTLSESTGGAAGDARDATVSHTPECQRAQRTKEEEGDGREWYLRLMSFNLLAESLTDYKYRALDQNIVCWANREKAIREEILRHRPAIGCLQEVDRNYYWRCFRSFLENSGYDSWYKQKTNGREDGLATFWLKGRFEVLECRELELSLYPNQRLGAEPQVALLLLLRERLSRGNVEHSDGKSSGGSSETGNSSDCGGYGSAESSSSPGFINRARTCSRPVQQGPMLGAQESSLRAGVASGGETCRSAVPDGSRSLASSSGLNSGSRAIPALPNWKDQEDRTRETARIAEEHAAVATSRANLSAIGNVLIVANTHLLFNSRRGDIKLAQLLQLLRGVQEMRGRAICRVKEELQSRSPLGRRGSLPIQCGSATSNYSTIHCAGKPGRGVTENDAGQPSETGLRREEVAAPENLLSVTAERLVDVLLCGDFNFTPHSPLYQLLLRGFFDFRGLDRKKLSGQFLMERRAYKMDAEGYHGRGSTVVSSPAESQLLSASDSGTPLMMNNLPDISQKHSWSTPALARAPPHSDKHLISPLQAQQQTEGTAQMRQHSPPLYSSTSAADVYNWSPQWLRDISHVFLDGSQSSDRNAAMPSAQSTSALDYASRVTAATTIERNARNDVTSLPRERRAPASPWIIQLPFRFRSAYALPRKTRVVALRGSEEAGVVAVRGSEEGYSPKVVMEEMEEPAFTAYHGWQKGCIDYVFYSSTKLQVGHVYQLPPLSNATQYGCCPNKLWPCSDHYSLVVDLVRRN